MAVIDGPTPLAHLMPLYTRIAQVHPINSLWNQINDCNLGNLALARIRLAHLFLERGSTGHCGRYKEVPLFSIHCSRTL